MERISTMRLTGALAIGAFGVLAACSPKKDQTTDTLATTPPATATTPTATPATGEVAGGWTDANVVDVLTVANQGEVDYSQIGVEKATNPSVKQFAQLMVKDHGTMLDAVKNLTTKLNVTPAANDKVNDLQKENQKDITDLNGKKVGKDFDKEFMDEQVDMHQETLDLLNDLDSKTTNADLKAAIAEAKPKVQAHLDQAKAIKDKVD
jgi:putative membrane protein